MGLFDEMFRRKPREEKLKVEPPPPPLKTFSFRVTGTTHLCRFTKHPGTDRSFVISRHKVGAPVYPYIYEWEGKPAVAIISVRDNEDLGVVPANLTKKVAELMQMYNVTGFITMIDTFEWHGEMYRGCDVTLECREKVFIEYLGK